MFSVHARSTRRRTPALVGAVIAMMLLAGCQGDADPSATEPSDQPSSSSAPTTAEASASASPSPEPSPASSLGPAANLPVPVKPALADENSKEGLEAFTRYWFELFSYGYETNDWVEYDDLTDAGCRTCANITTQVRGAYAGGGWIDGGEISVNSVQTEYVENTAGSINSLVDVQQTELIYYDSAGLELGRSEALASTINSTIALWDGNRWIMLDFGSLEGT